MDILLQDSFLIPTKDQMNALGIIADGKVSLKLFVFCFIGLFWYCLGKEFVESEKLHIPEQFLNIWLSFLVYCNEIQLINSLFDKLIHSLANESFHMNDESQQLRNKFLFAWILTLIKYNSFKNGIVSLVLMHYFLISCSIC